MRDFAISAVVSVIVSMFLNPKFEIVKNYYLERGCDLSKINSVSYIYFGVTTFVFCLLICGFLKLIRLVLNYFSTRGYS